ncbi:MAG TPA: hypothetical protein VK545_08340 [Streptomyces sp.]|nr:hypothetical protein [Streptomyces sp.]
MNVSNHLPAPAPKGITSLTDVTDVTGSTPDSLADLDVIADAIAAVQDQGGEPTHILVSPGVAKHLAKLKTGSGSNQPLLGTDATKPTVRTAYGLPLVTVRALTDSALHVVDGSRIAVVLPGGHRRHLQGPLLRVRPSRRTRPRPRRLRLPPPGDHRQGRRHARLMKRSSARSAFRGGRRPPP